MMRVEINRLDYTGFKEIVINASLLDVTRSFSLSTISTNVDDWRLKVGNSIRIYADDEMRLDGFIEGLERVQDPGSDTIVLSGRSKTSDLVDSTIDSNVQFRGKQSLRTVAETLIQYLEGFDPVITIPTGIAPELEPFIRVAIDEDINDFREDEDLNEEVGQSYFEVIEKFAKKRSVLVTTNGAGDLVFTRGRGYLPTPFKIFNLASDSSSNNLKTMRVKHNSSKRYNIYVMTSQPARGDFTKLSEITPENLILTNADVIDPNVRRTRRMFIITENASSKSDCQDRTRWEAIRKQSESVIYNVELNGHSQNGNVWDSNIAVDVNDEFADINGKMLVRDVSFRQAVGRGSVTRLVCVPPNSYNFDVPVQESIGDLYSDIPLGVF